MIRTRFALLTGLLSLALIAAASPPVVQAQAPARDSIAVAQAAPQDSLAVNLAKGTGVGALILLVGVGLMGTIRTVAPDLNSAPTTQGSRIQGNNLTEDVYYFFLNRPAWQVAAAAVAPPVCARATTASKVKTTATTQLFLNGIPLSLTATDNLWTLTGSNLAAGSVRRYLLLWDGTSATTVPTVLASNDQVVANFSSTALALAACRFPNLPAAGTGIVGILSIANTTNAFVPGTTLLSATGVTDTYIDGIDDSVFRSAKISG